jgi:hypothetical protein
MSYLEAKMYQLNRKVCSKVFEVPVCSTELFKLHSIEKEKPDVQKILSIFSHITELLGTILSNQNKILSFVCPYVQDLSLHIHSNPIKFIISTVRESNAVTFQKWGLLSRYMRM